MAENAELHKDKAFLKRAQSFMEAVDQFDKLGLFPSPPSRDDPFTGSRAASKYFKDLQKQIGEFPVILDTSKRNRAVRAFLNQTGPEFVEPLVNWYEQFYRRGNLDPSTLLQQIGNKESSLRAPAKTGRGSGTEAHHQIALSTADRLKNMPLKDQLETFSLLRALGFPVGTYPEEMLMLSRWRHQGDPVGVTAHSDPVRFMPGVDSSVDQGVWKAEPFPAGTSPQEAVERLIDETIRPQNLMNQLAFSQPDEAQGRKIMNQIAGGDLWTGDLQQRASLAKEVEAARNRGILVDMSQYVRNPQIKGPIPESDLAEYLKIGKVLPIVSDSVDYNAGLGTEAYGQLKKHLSRNWRGELLNSATAAITPESAHAAGRGDWGTAAAEAVKSIGTNAVVGGATNAALSHLMPRAAAALASGPVMPLVAGVGTGLLLQDTAQAYRAGKAGRSPTLQRKIEQTEQNKRKLQDAAEFRNAMPGHAYKNRMPANLSGNLSPQQIESFKSGGGNAAMMRDGLTVQQVMERGQALRLKEIHAKILREQT